MRLTDIMSAAGLSSWAEVGLILSVITFSAIVAYAFVVRSRASYEDARHLPLEEEGGCRVRRFRRFAGEPSDVISGSTDKSSESSDLAPPRESS